MSPNKCLRAEAEVACSLWKELGTHAHKKNRLFMGGRANLSDIYNGEELLVQRSQRMTPTHGASLSPELLQGAIGTAAVIVHAYDSDVCVVRGEIEDHIQRLVTEVIEKEDVLWVEYTRVAFSMVATIFAEYKKTITEDSRDGGGPYISHDEVLT
ncbi:hypothetical protein POM88_001434 [Heracleum sosnowskyi]|uniref:Uncharacterized protein n=1 Tax=Heracleum sosnowskyi TaxID=360622 RepID=A0AAD8JCZ6_9APIA|nr:hypothetical protein POM88_001434 [Heracleum sosnowskyi]